MEAINKDMVKYIDNNDVEIGWKEHRSVDHPPINITDDVSSIHPTPSHLMSFTSLSRFIQHRQPSIQKEQKRGITIPNPVGDTRQLWR